VSPERLHDRIATALALAVLMLGIAASVFGSYDNGISWAIDNGRLVVGSVVPNSPAARDGITGGMVAVQYNNETLIRLPTYQYGDPDPAKPEEAPPVIGVSPERPTSTVPDDGALWSILRTPMESLSLISSASLETFDPNQWPVFNYWYPGVHRFFWAPFALIPGMLILAAGFLWLRTGTGPSVLRPIAVPLALAVAAPLLVAPIAEMGSFWFVILAQLLLIAAEIPLALGLAQRIERADDRRLVQLAVATLAAGALLAAVGQAAEPSNSSHLLSIVLAAAIPFVPGVIAAGPIDLSLLRNRRRSGVGGVIRAEELALAGGTPAFAMLTDSPPVPWWLIVWLLGIAIAVRFTVRPLARLATRATLQRDLVVAAAEAERARLAADIHDDALQELTLLVRRLEASGDTEGAEIGRTVADRLRAICGDLRLPILDDLGVGPALDWLVLRIERLAGGEVRLERADDARHAPDVELAIFRVAQEALANAVKHGKPPIVVRYRSTPAGISLAVDDAGPGIAEDAPEVAEQAGRFGLLNMAQRAEQIGAILDVRRWPGGGTHVALEWRPR
jgi:signal transduction histidine kinase